jgi:hypothetical protein
MRIGLGLSLTIAAIVSVVSNAFLLEDGSSYLLLEDGSKLLLE